MDLCKSNISTRSIGNLYLNDNMADVNFVLDNSERVSAHKNILAAVSAVFRERFYGPTPVEGDFEHHDVSAPVFKEFLQFFYLNEIRLTVENLLGPRGVIYLTNHYEMPECQEIYVKFLQSKITINNVLECYSTSNAFHFNAIRHL